MTIIAGIAGLANLVCFIIVLIKLFQEKGPLHGILGFFCSLYTFIWGWMSAGALNIKNIMIIWTVSILIYMATGGAAMASMMKQMQDLG